jgi:hypothetical protein
MSTPTEEARRQRIEAAARKVWPDCDPYAIDGFAGGYLYADVGDVRVKVSWQQDGPSAMPEVRLVWRGDSDNVRRMVEDVAELHRLLTEGEP